MPEVLAVSISPTSAVPVMIGAPVAGLLAVCGWTAGLTVPVAVLVNVSSFPASSVKLTRTLMVLSISLVVRT